jgi:hypothetical protein
MGVLNITKGPQQVLAAENNHLSIFRDMNFFSRE